MKEYKLEDSPIVYYISGNDHKEWVLFLHAAFVNHHMFRQQIDYFRHQYNLLVPDLIGHGRPTDTKKGDNIGRMYPLPVLEDMISTILTYPCKNKTALLRSV